MVGLLTLISTTQSMAESPTGDVPNATAPASVGSGYRWTRTSGASEAFGDDTAALVVGANGDDVITMGLNTPALTVSGDGREWSPATISGIGKIASHGDWEPFAVTAVDGSTVVAARSTRSVGDGGTIPTSPTFMIVSGVHGSWTAHATDLPAWFVGEQVVAATGHLYMVGGDDRSSARPPLLFVSDDAIAWTRIPIPADVALARSVGVDGTGRIVIAGTMKRADGEVDIAWSSADGGATWATADLTSDAEPVSSQGPLAVAGLGQGFVTSQIVPAGLATSARLMWSADGQSWEETWSGLDVPLPTGLTAVSGGVIVFTNTPAGTLASTDGRQWMTACVVGMTGISDATELTDGTVIAIGTDLIEGSPEGRNEPVVWAGIPTDDSPAPSP